MIWSIMGSATDEMSTSRAGDFYVWYTGKWKLPTSLRFFQVKKSLTGRLFTFHRVVMSLTPRTFAFRLLLGVMLSSLALSCKDYEYVNPGPGVLEVRLKVINSRQDLIPFGPSNDWVIMLKDLNGLQAGNVKLRIYSDVNAIRRTPDGDPLNTLDTLARDSSIIMGQMYASPTQTFTGIDFTVNFSPMLRVFRNGLPIANQILVNAPLPPAPTPQTYFQVPPDQSLNITVLEGRTTRVTVTINLDSVLVRRSETFELNPSFYVSSVQTL
jgi:hypothetical protein